MGNGRRISSGKGGRELRRNRLAGICIFVVLSVACVWYYRCYFAGDTRTVSVHSQDSAKRKTAQASPVGGDVSKETPQPSETFSGTVSATSEEWRLDYESVCLPAAAEDDILIYNAGGRYTINYDTLYRQAAWVAYVLTRGDVTAHKASRRDRFVPDPQVEALGYDAVRTSEYRGCGYDRGHLCPSADRTRSQSENDCTFVMSNISPQSPALNRGVWKSLEEEVRRWAVRYDTVCVVAGGILRPGLDTLDGGIGIPEYFYKTVLLRDGNGLRAAAFIMPNGKNLSGDWRDYAVSVDSLEVFSSYDFFAALPDEVEAVVESVAPDAGGWLN